jgi:hypothetical protein
MRCSEPGHYAVEPTLPLDWACREQYAETRRPNRPTLRSKAADKKEDV